MSGRLIYFETCDRCGGPTLSWILEAFHLEMAGLAPPLAGCHLCHQGLVFPLPRTPDDRPMHVPDLDPNRISARARHHLVLAERAIAAFRPYAASLHALRAACECEANDEPHQVTLIFRAVADLWKHDISEQPRGAIHKPDVALLRVEVMRRLGLFDEAQAIAENTLPELLDNAMARGLIFCEQELIRLGSTEKLDHSVARHYAVDGVHRRILRASTKEELRDIGVDDLAALLDGNTQQHVTAREVASHDLAARRQPPPPRPVLTREQRESTRRDIARVREIFRLAREHSQLRESLVFWKSPKAFLGSSLVTHAVLHEMDVDTLATHLTEATSGRCPQCGFRFGLETVAGQLLCNHCGWPNPPVARLAKPIPSAVSFDNVNRLIAQRNKCKRANPSSRPFTRNQRI